MRIILASKSPRRREILEMLGLDFEVMVSDADEASELTDPARLVEELSRRKGLAVYDRLRAAGEDISDTLIISSDTVVSCDGEILEKPRDAADAARMLCMLSGREHTVFSGIAACFGGKCLSDVSGTRVHFAELSDAKIKKYLESGEYADKAGAYAIQGTASLFITGIEGDYFTVVGLPVRKLYELLLGGFGIDMQEL